MSLRTKILVLLVAVVLTFVALDVAVHRILVQRRFAELEQDIALQQMGRAKEAVDREVRSVASIASNLAAWLRGDAERYGLEFVGGPSTLEGCELDLLFVCRSNGEILWSRIEDPDTRTETLLRDFPRGMLHATHPLLAEGAPSGLILTKHGPLIVAASPLPAEGGEEGDGRVIAGRFLTGEAIERIAEQIHVGLSITSIDDPALTAEERELADRTVMSREPVMEEPDENRLTVYCPLEDLRGIPVLLMEVDVAREVMRRGFASATDSLLSGVALAMLLLLSLTLILRAIVIGPLGRLTRHATEVGRTNDTSLRLDSTRQDEIGILSRELDAMVEELDRMRRDNVEMARFAGQSEVASGVLHNVGNVLNSVNVSTKLFSSTVGAFPVKDLELIVEQLHKNRGELDAYLERDPRGRHLLPFLDKVLEVFDDERERAMKEAARVLDGVEHIERLVFAQQDFVSRAAHQEWVSLGQQLDSALEIARSASGSLGEVDVVRDYADVPSVYLDRHRLSGILVNLILNAGHALADADEPRLELRVHQDEGGRVTLEVADNGKGIEEEDLVRVFHAGFTTRAEGRGFGLHTAASSAIELGASLTGNSDGEGCGATFRLHFSQPIFEGQRAA